MEYIKLNNGMDMPVLGFGTFMLGGETCENSVAEAIRCGCAADKALPLIGRPNSPELVEMSLTW